LYHPHLQNICISFKNLQSFDKTLCVAKSFYTLLLSLKIIVVVVFQGCSLGPFLFLPFVDLDWHSPPSLLVYAHQQSRKLIMEKGFICLEIIQNDNREVLLAVIKVLGGPEFRE